MSVLVLSTGHEIPVEGAPAAAQDSLASLLERGEKWGFSDQTGAWFQLRHVVAILPDREPPPKPRTRRAAVSA